jgi:drug/metabolite transporter (DMT)-like permease
VTGYVFFGEVPNATLWLGATLIVGSGILLGWGAARRPAAGPTGS